MVGAPWGHYFDPQIGSLKVHFPLGVPERGRLLAGTDQSTWCGDEASAEPRGRRFAYKQVLLAPLRGSRSEIPEWLSDDLLKVMELGKWRS